MNSAEVLTDGFDRVNGAVHDAVEGLSPDDLNTRLDDGSNPVGWLVWHLTRVQDDHLADATGADQVWSAQDWSARFALPLPVDDTGYGHSAAQVASVRIGSAGLLLGYHDAVHERTRNHVRGLGDAQLDRVVDEAWTPPVTLGVRLVSVLAEGLQHAGQAAFVRGVLERR